MPFVVGHLLLQHEDFGFQLVPLVQDVSELLKCEAGAVGVFEVQISCVLITQRLLQVRSDAVSYTQQTTG